MFIENIFIGAVLLILTVIISIKFYLDRVFSYWKSRGVPALSPKYPFGNANDFVLSRCSIGELFRHLYTEVKRNGWKYGGSYCTIIPTLIVADPDLIKSITSSDFDYFTDRVSPEVEKLHPLTAQLAVLPGPRWKKRRNQLSPIFTSVKIKMLSSTLLECTSELLAVVANIIENHEVFDAEDVFERFTSDIVGSFNFGINCNSFKNQNPEFLKHGKRAFFNRSFIDNVKRITSVAFPKLVKILPFLNLDFYTYNFFLNIVKETIKFRKENGIVRKDFMQLMMELKNEMVGVEDKNQMKKTNLEQEDYPVLSDEQIAAEATGFFTAGFETSSASLTFCFYEMASNLEIQEKVRQEVQEVIARHGGKFTYDAIMEMDYLDQCVSENLRKYPPAPFNIRICTKPYRIPDSNVVVEKDTVVFISSYGVHHDPEYYPDPEKFDPERFSPDNKINRNQYTYLPFGRGPRNCIGMKLGLLQIKVGVAVLLKDYRFQLNPKMKTPLIMDPYGLILFPKNGVWLDVEKV